MFKALRCKLIMPSYLKFLKSISGNYRGQDCPNRDEESLHLINSNKSVIELFQFLFKYCLYLKLLNMFCNVSEKNIEQT